MRGIAAACCVVMLAGCSHALELHSRDGAPSGSGSAEEVMRSVTIDLGGKVYRGTYTFNGGSVISTTSTAFGSSSRGGTATATAYGTTYAPGSGNGRIFATSGPGDSIRCEFSFRGMNGLGVCSDNSGRVYDLVIR